MIGRAGTYKARQSGAVVSFSGILRLWEMAGINGYYA